MQGKAANEIKEDEKKLLGCNYWYGCVRKLPELEKLEAVFPLALFDESIKRFSSTLNHDEEWYLRKFIFQKCMMGK